MKCLSNVELNKIRKGRLRGELFLEKYQNQKSFEDIHGNQINLHLCPENIRLLKEMALSRRFDSTKFNLKDSNGNSVKLSHLAKTKDLGGMEPPGKWNEVFLYETIKSNIEKNTIIDVKFKSKDTYFESKGVTAISHTAHDVKAYKKADIILHTTTANVPISLKKDTAEDWESADRRYCKQAKECLDDLVFQKRIHLEITEEKLTRITPLLAIQATEDEKKSVVFGSDILEGKGCVLIRSFVNTDFSTTDNYLDINVSKIITSVDQLVDKYNIWFVVRHDSNRNTTGFYKGLRILAKAEFGLTKSTLKIN